MKIVFFLREKQIFSELKSENIKILIVKSETIVHPRKCRPKRKGSSTATLLNVNPQTHNMGRTPYAYLRYKYFFNWSI
ncbi:hypothetical protein GM418_00085 [Maribellus comscasis]|uniref:Uncharacterized protein n=1 Tax=Maribellus comscasis TaxID=2681766 RepID=A0A6I6JM60_9BACT|nr:hypothetical protein [Maribellus comscasis]QGY42108.1 hypothetical protein GM418_00085 [Maribellus comscasis]